MGVAGGDSEHIGDKEFLLDSFNKPPLAETQMGKKRVFSKVLNIYFNLDSALVLINCLESKTK